MSLKGLDNSSAITFSICFLPFKYNPRTPRWEGRGADLRPEQLHNQRQNDTTDLSES